MRHHFHGSGAASAPASPSLSCADSPQLDSDSATFTRKRSSASSRRRSSERVRLSLGANLSEGSGGGGSLWTLCWVVGSPAARRALIWHRGARSPDPGNSGRNAFAENLPTHQARLPRAGLRFTFTFVRTDVKSADAPEKKPERRRCGSIRIDPGDRRSSAIKFRFVI